MQYAKWLFISVELLFFVHSGCVDQNKFNKAIKIANDVFGEYYHMFDECINTPMSNQRFMVDNLNSYINDFSKTTVGYAPLFTSNRKFFANMLNTAAFKNMMEKDINTLHLNYLEKMKFCDESVMDQDSLRQFYDKEVDQTKL
ncbi:uncharacterized protein LOC112048973 [Bicyclus anynana]|uniref:Uncharacterized protein LOC112048973 n=1 Tax=Bicyclus anynana TaxID=110368 RepID=A0A6J1NBS1_BICAN|nr:uncharacterized protein LOC112048973 [Bicyclus anynana]